MKIWIDGSGWNGKRCGWCIAPESGEPMIDFYEDEYTNNEMEYTALIKALLHYAQKGDEILSDSALVVNQVNGKWKVKEPRLFPFCQEAKAHMKRIGCTLTWIPREENMAGHLLEKK